MGHPRIVITGDLVEHARHHMYANGLHAVLVLISQPGAAPVLAERAFGSGWGANWSASQAARAMRKGQQVTAHGHAIRSSRFEKQAVMRLEGVDHIEHAAARAHHEPQSAATAA